MASLSLRTGTLGKRLAAHLLRRCTYKVSPSRIAYFAGLTAEAAVNELCIIPALTHPEGPLNQDTGLPWLTNGDYATPPGSNSDRAVHLWYFGELLKDTSIRHKMTTFLASSFVTEQQNYWRIFEHYRLLQFYAVGSIKTFAKKVTMDNKMLIYLNNNLNKRSSPNENYAREFLELFTILKGPQVGVGNYTNYTEHDIQQTARLLTGFTTGDFTNKDSDTGLATGTLNYNNHDRGIKKFSAAFQYQEIQGATSDVDMLRELQDFIDMVFNQLETAKAYVRKLYIFFVSDLLTPEIESDIITPLATQLKNDNYEVLNVLKTLLKSKHFYDEDDSTATDEIIGGKIKSALDLFVGGIHTFDADNMGALNANLLYYSSNYHYRIYNRTLELMGLAQDPGSVEGHLGYFKEPSYSRFWIDQSTISQRYRMDYILMQGKALTTNNSLPFTIDIMAFFNTYITNHQYVDEVVTQFLQLCLPELPTGDRYNYFREKILGGLSPINWMFEWNTYLTTGDASSVKIVFEDLFIAVCKSPEFQTY